MIKFHLHRGDDPEGFVTFIDWAAFTKYVNEQGTVIVEAPDGPGHLMKLKLVG